MAVKRARTEISELQKELLVAEYDNGLKTSAGKENKAKIARLSAETGLSTTQITNWIGNYRKKSSSQERAGSTDDADTAKPNKVPLFRRPNPWNLFFSHYSKKEPYSKMDLKERNLAVKNLYSSLTPAKKDEWQEKARSFENSASNCSPEVVNKLKNQIQSQFNFLAQAGCRAVCLFQDQNSKLWNLGTADAEEFLDSNPQVENAYRSYLAMPAKFTQEHVRELFNQKFAESLNKPGAAVPYKKREMFEVEGLPDGVPFQKPNAYGRIQVNKVMENRDSLRFIILDRDGILTKSRKPWKRNDLVLARKRSALEKIVTSEILDQVMNGERKIQENEIEVLADILPEEKKILLGNCVDYFDESALPLLQQVCKRAHAAGCEDDAIILPCYADMEEQDVIYWLFLTSKAVLDCDEIKGKWLDRVPNQQLKYEIWGEEETSISKENAILRDGQFIVYKQHADFNQCGSTIMFSSQCLIELEHYIKSSLLLEN